MPDTHSHDHTFKCMRCEERHYRQVEDSDLQNHWLVPCPICGFVARRIAAPAGPLTAGPAVRRVD